MVTHYSIINVSVWVPVPSNVPRPGADYMLVPGVIIGLTFTPMPSCVTARPDQVTVSADHLTHEERAVYNANHPPPPPQASPMTAREFLASITGVSQVVDCITSPSFGGCAIAAAAIAPIPAGKAISAAGRAAAEGGAAILSVIYRGGTKSPSNLRLREGESALSFRDSLSDPLPPASPVFTKREWIAIDTSKLPPDRVRPDGIPGSATTPPGHVSVFVDDILLLQDAVIDRGKFPPR